MTPILTAHLSEARRADLAPAIGILAEWSNKRGKKARQRLPKAWRFFSKGRTVLVIMIGLLVGIRS
jgi:hypothetical protein